jgi:hypothetical protein
LLFQQIFTISAIFLKSTKRFVFMISYKFARASNCFFFLFVFGEGEKQKREREREGQKELLPQKFNLIFSELAQLEVCEQNYKTVYEFIQSQLHETQKKTAENRFFFCFR